MSSSMQDFLKERKKKLTIEEPKVEKVERKIEPKKVEKAEFKLVENDVKVLKFYCEGSDIEIPVLVSLVLHDKIGRPVKESHIFDLKLRGYVDDEGVITESGKAYLSEEATKNRVKELLKD